jgi:hypothetical protein
MIEVYLSLHKNQLNSWANHDFLIQIALELKNNYGAKIVYKEGELLKVEKFNYTLPDCEIMVYDNEKDILLGYSFSENRTKLYDEVFVKRNNPNDILIAVHQDCNWGLQTIKTDHLVFKLKRCAFQPYGAWINYNFFYRKRQFIDFEKLIDGIFFRCTTGRGDEEALHKLDIVNDRFSPLSQEKYLDMAINYKVGLSIPNSAGICHRDIDCMAIGLPLMRLEMYGEYYPKLIPNYHYISISNKGFSPNGVINGGPEYVEAYVNRFMEVKDDFQFLNFISENAHNYFEENCSQYNRLSQIFKLWEII